MEQQNKQNGWEPSNIHQFWGEVAPCDHLVQIYDSEEVVLDSLEGFINSGVRVGDSVVVIATPIHLQALKIRLISLGAGVKELLNTHHYIPLDAHEMLAKFMRNDWPDEMLFTKTVTEALALARGTKNLKVRAYGEMAAILWAQGHTRATLHLEHLWNKFAQGENICLFCAYPKSGFMQDTDASIEHVYSAHSKIICGEERSKTEVRYKCC